MCFKYKGIKNFLKPACSAKHIRLPGWHSKFFNYGQLNYISNWYFSGAGRFFTGCFNDDGILIYL